jgi:hypothetical protein
MHIGFWWESQKKYITRKTKMDRVYNIEMDLGERGYGVGFSGGLL